MNALAKIPSCRSSTFRAISFKKYLVLYIYHIPYFVSPWLDFYAKQSRPVVLTSMINNCLFSKMFSLSSGTHTHRHRRTEFGTTVAFLSEDYPRLARIYTLVKFTTLPCGWLFWTTSCYSRDQIVNAGRRPWICPEGDTNSGASSKGPPLPPWDAQVTFPSQK